MKRVRKRRGNAVQLQVPGPDQRMMGEVWWMGEGWTGPEESWRVVKTGWLEEKWRGVGRCLQFEPVGMWAAAAAQKEDKLDSPLPLPVGSAVARVRRDTGEGGVRVKSKWVVRGRWMLMGMEVQGQAQVLLENLKNRAGGAKQTHDITSIIALCRCTNLPAGVSRILHLSPTINTANSLTH